MPMEALEAPTCTHKEGKEDPCGRLMFRIGTASVWGWVCERCDTTPRDRGIDPT